MSVPRRRRRRALVIFSERSSRNAACLMPRGRVLRPTNCARDPDPWFAVRGRGGGQAFPLHERAQRRRVADDRGVQGQKPGSRLFLRARRSAAKVAVISARRCAFRLASGSSHSITLASCASARASGTRRRRPPDNASGLRPPRPVWPRRESGADARSRHARPRRTQRTPFTTCDSPGPHPPRGFVEWMVRIYNDICHLAGMDEDRLRRVSMDVLRERSPAPRRSAS